ncbi:MAG: SDR family oxidoreductase [Rhodospirillales bacterium]|nr:SDR family oxidoreductase [Rhodospirillales bacterium]
MGKLTGKAALVTGASRGLGAAIALAFADEGADVAVNYVRRQDKANEVAAEIRKRGRRAIVVQADCTSEEQVKRMVDTVLREFGEIRILMNNAGILTQMPLVDMPLARWEEMMASHLRSHFLVTKACLPSMLKLKPMKGERRAAKIINMSSGIGQKGGAGGATIVHYVTAKAGILGFTKALAGELAPLITVNCIAPGTHPTDILGDLTEEWKVAKEKQFLLGFGTVEDVALTAAFIASPDADYYTGQILTPNGGDVMNG